MKLKDLTLQELEAMSYDDIAYMVLEEKNKPMKINDLFREVCNLLKLSDKDYEDKIADFFEVLSTDHRFVMIEKGLWDLKIKHSAKIVMDIDEEDDILADALSEDDDEEEEEEEDIYYEGDETDDQSEDDLKDLVIIDDDEEANGLM